MRNTENVTAAKDITLTNYVFNPSSNAKNFVKILRTQIGLLKVHKAASTTLQAIFLRFGWKRNLTFVLPPEYNYFGYPNIISIYDPPNGNNTLPPPSNKTFDILCHHVLYNKEEWAKYLPLGYSLIGSVREPWELFKSMLNYMNPLYIRRIKSSDKVATYLHNPLKFEPKDIQLSMTNNRMSIEFGVHPDIITHRNFKAFNAYLKELGEDFGVVIVAEQFDESLVLLRRYLHWPLKDILYISKNIRRPWGNETYMPHMEQIENFKSFSAFDYLLYDFFKKKLNNQIAAEGPLFAKEVERFKEVRELVENFCYGILVDIHYVTISSSEWHPEFDIKRDECDLLRKGEIEFTQDIRKRQYGSATWSYLGYPKMRRDITLKKFLRPSNDKVFYIYV